jgi:hypothetical protein
MYIYRDRLSNNYSKPIKRQHSGGLVNDELLGNLELSLERLLVTAH